MGGGVSLQQLQQLPEVLDQDLFTKLVKDKKFAPECYSIFADYNGMISRKRLQEICITRDCYLSYEWGIDTKGRATHRRVAQIADYLSKKKGLIIYAEDGQYRNNTPLVNLTLQERIQQSLATSSCMIMFFTKRYFEKFVEEKKAKKLPSAVLFTTLQQQQRGLVVPKKKTEVEQIRREEEKSLDEVEENQLQLEFQLFRDLKKGSTRYILPVVLEDKAGIDFAPQLLKDHFGHRLIINASNFEENMEEVLNGLFDYVVKTINPMRLGGPFLQRNQIYGQTDEGKLLIWLRKCLGVQNNNNGGGSGKGGVKVCAEETIEKYLRILLEENMNSFLKLYGVLQVDDQYLIRLGFQECHSQIIYQRLEKEIKENLMMENIRQIDSVMARQKDKDVLEQQKYHDEINEVVENAKKMKELTLMAGEDTLSYTLRAYEQQVVKSISFEQMQVKFFKQLLEDQVVYQEKVSAIQDMLWKEMEARVVGDRLQRLQQVLEIDSVDKICELFRNTIGDLERTLVSTSTASGRRDSMKKTTFSDVVTSAMSANTSTNVSATASPTMSRRTSAFVPPAPTTTDGSPQSVTRKEAVLSKFKSLVKYGVTHQLTATGDFESTVQDLSELSYLLQVCSTILHKIQRMSQDNPDQVSRFVDQGISKLLLTLLSKGYMYTSHYPSLFSIDNDSHWGADLDEESAFDPRRPIHDIIFQQHRKLYLPHQVMLTMSFLMQCQLDKHSLHEQLVYLFGKSGSIDLMIEIIKFHMEHLSIVVLCLHVIDMLMSTQQGPIRQQHIHNFLQNFSYLLLLMILLEKYDLQHLDDDLEDEDDGGLLGGSPSPKKAKKKPHASNSNGKDIVPHDRTSLTLQYVALRTYIISIFTKCAVFSQEMVMASQRRNSMVATGANSHAASRRGSTATNAGDNTSEAMVNYYQDLLSKSRPALISRAVNELLVWYIQQHPHIVHRTKKDDTAPFLTPTKQRETKVAKAQEETLKNAQPPMHMTDDLLLTLITSFEVIYLDRRKVYSPTHHYRRDELSGELHPVDVEAAMALLTAEARKKQSEAMKKRLQEIDAKIAKDLLEQEEARKKKLQAKKDITTVNANHREVLEQLAKEEADEIEKARQQAREQRRRERVEAKKAQAEERKKKQEEEESKKAKGKQVNRRKRSLRESMTILLNEFYLIPFLIHQLRRHRTNSSIVIAIVRSLGNMLYLRDDLRRRANEFSLSGELMLIVKEGLKLFRQHHANKKKKPRASSPQRAQSPEREGGDTTQKKHESTSHSSKLQSRKLGIEILRESFITLSNYFTVLSPEVVVEDSGDGNSVITAPSDAPAENFLYPSWDCIHYCVEQGLCEIVLEIFSQSQLDNKLLRATLLLIHKMIQCGNFLTCSRFVAIGFIDKLALFLDMNMTMDNLIFELTCQILISLSRSDEIRINAGKRLIEKTRADSWLITHIRRLCLAKGTNGHWTHYYSHAILDIHPEDVSEVGIALSSAQSNTAAAAAAATLPSFNHSMNAMYQMSSSNLPGVGKSADPILKKKVCKSCILGCTLIHTLCKHSTHGNDFMRKIRIAGFQQWLHKAPLVVGEERDMHALPKSLDVPQLANSVNMYRHRKSTVDNPSMQLLHNINDMPTPEKTKPSEGSEGEDEKEESPEDEKPPSKPVIHYMLPVDTMLDSVHLPFQDRSVEFTQNISKAYFDEMIQDVFRMFNVDYGPLLLPPDEHQSQSQSAFRHK